MTTRLPLVAAQPGIWMAERLSTLPGARPGAWPTMLNCAAPSTRRCWEKRLSPVCSRRTPSACALRKRRGKSGSGWRPTAPLPNRRSLTCVRRRIRIAPPRSGCRRTGAGSACRRRQPAGVPSAAARRRRPLVLVSAISPLAGGWLQLPGDNPADRRHLPRPGSGGKPLLSRLSPPFAEVVDEYQRYAGSEASAAG